MNLQTWLEQNGLEKYRSLFAGHEIEDLETLAFLNEAELEAMGLPIGPRKKILNAFSQASPAVSQTPAPEAVEEPSQQTAQSHATVPAGASRIESKGKSSSKATAILIAVGVHVVLILIATTLTIFAASKDEPGIVASIAAPSTSPQQEIKKKTVQKQVKRTSSSSAAAAPMAQMMKSSAEASFTVPDVTRTSTGPLGVGEGDFGSGSFGSGLDTGSGGGATLFGSTGSGSLKGYLYDFKRDSKGRPRRITGMENVVQGYKDYMPFLHKLIQTNFSTDALNDHMRIGKPLSYTYLAIPPQNAEIGPEAFGAKGEMEPSGWLAVYRGKVRTKGVEIRLIGRFDDVLLVMHNGKVVLDGTLVIPGAPTATNLKSPGEIKNHPLFKGRQGGRIGPWFKLQGGDELIIAVGEIPGGGLGGGLFCQEKGVKYKQGNLSPFVIGKLSDEDRTRLKKIKDCTLEKIPEIY